MVRRTLLLTFIFMMSVAARQRAVQHPVIEPHHLIPEDAYSYAEPEKIRVTHVDLDLTVDFEARRLSGNVRLDLLNITGTRTLVLDTEELTIAKVTRDDGRAARWSLGPRSIVYGTPLTIEVEPSTRWVSIDYATSDVANGLLWNTAEQSYGRRQPYLYTQSEAADARSWIPLQDTPTVRQTYDATIRVPRGLLALMSAENPTVVNATGVYDFHMPQTIPSYLIALAVGRLEFRPLDERTGVYAEPELIDDAAWELQYIPDMVDAAERLAGPYPFSRYDVLLMPPTYVVGGMEHPRLNFINPFSVVTFNRPAKLTPSSLIAHELAHSWAGDQTTLATWRDVWLNEGITSYLTERILEVMSGPERAEYDFMSYRRSFQAQVDSAKDPRTLLLHRPYKDNEPADFGFNNASYVKGALFIKTLEDLIGRETFDRSLREYFRLFAWRWVDDRNFIAFLREKGLYRADLRVEEWIYEPGLPSNVTAPASSRLNDRMAAAAQSFRGGTPMSAIDTTGWTAVELDLFLQHVTVTGLLSRMAEVDSVLGLSNRPTPPGAWLTASIRATYAPGLVAVERALMRGGSNSTIVSLYANLLGTAEGRNIARRVFPVARPRYSDSVAAQVEQMMKQAGVTSALAPIAAHGRASTRGGRTRAASSARARNLAWRTAA